MLIITRKISEKLQIGDDLIVHVVNIRDDSVSLIITLPNGDVKSEVMSEDEKIHVTEDVIIMATEIQGKSQVRLGVLAPSNMFIKRIPK